ncbi:MAG: outer membrane beta-barrel protein [Pseudomonadota bacterium]
MKKILSACAIAAAAFTAAPAFAQGYVGLGFGSSKITGVDGNIVGAGIPAGTVFSGGNTSKGLVKIYGGFQFTPNWGVELQYSDLGNRGVVATSAAGAVLVSGSYKASQYSIAGTGTLPLSAGFSLFGKLGVTSNKGNLSVNGGGVTANSTGSQSSLLAGVGVKYNITPALALRLEYEDFGKMTSGNGFGGTVRGNAYSLNLQYGF